MYGMESGQEFLAGWTDGMLAARVAMRNAVRREMVRYALELTADDRVVASASPEPVAEKVPGPDNPLGDQDYADGWERGFRDGHGAVATALREALAREDLFLSDTGNIVTARLASILVDWLRSRVETPDIADEAIHAFIDGATENLTPPAREPATVPPTPQPAPPSRQRGGVWNMIRRNLDRRAALAAFSGALAMGTLGWFTWVPHGQDKPPTEQTQLPAGSPPTPAIWSTYPADAQQALTTIHSVVVGFDQSGNTTGAITLGQQLMSLPASQDGWKRYLVMYVMDVRRGDLLPALMGGLSPTQTGANLRAMIVGAVRYIGRGVGQQAVPIAVIQGLQAYRDSQIEPDSNVRKILARTLTDLGG